MKKFLRIKRVYLEQILAGKKRFEYRKIAPFYSWLESPELKTLILHYQKDVRVEVDVIYVRKIRTPKRLREVDWCDFGSKCYQIALENPRLA